MCHPSHIITRWKETHSYVVGPLSSVFALIHPAKARANHGPCFTLTQGSCSVQPLSTTPGPMSLHWDKLGLSTLLKGFWMVVTDGSESMSCSFPCPDNTPGDLGKQLKQKDRFFYLTKLCPNLIESLKEASQLRFLTFS